jgi:hypothetical protein
VLVYGIDRPQELACDPARADDTPAHAHVPVNSGRFFSMNDARAAAWSFVV